MEEIFKVSGTYHERTKQMVEHLVGTDSNLNGGNNVSTNDDDRIEVTVQHDGTYIILAKGSYRNRAYTNVNVFFSIYTDQNRLLGCRQVATNCNNYPEAPLSEVIKIDKVKLKCGDKVELRFGNSGSSKEQSQGFHYAAPKDFIILSKTDH